MVEKQGRIDNIVRQFYKRICDIYPVKKVILYGSYAKGSATEDSDIDVGVVIDIENHLQRMDITSDMFHHAHEIDNRIEPKCIFLDEYVNREKASILSEIVQNGKEIV
ncbi:nucleotidyltransferase domain-containing protein [Candidatus Sumerlaeota bacterium]|nr:nucleotidyltransferase domain-containing protein [Candidatus Sumerlaeota bacterium]